MPSKCIHVYYIFKCKYHWICRRKLQAKLNEAEESLRNLESKYSSLDKTKARIAAELEDVNLDLEKVNNTWINKYLTSFWFI